MRYACADGGASTTIGREKQAGLLRPISKEAFLRSRAIIVAVTFGVFLGYNTFTPPKRLELFSLESRAASRSGTAAWRSRRR